MVRAFFMDQSFSKSERLKSNEQIATVFKKGSSCKQGFLILRYAPNTLEQNRIAFSVPKRRVASAARRNQIKRRLREVFRQNKESLEALWPEQRQDLVLIYLAAEAHSLAKMESNYLKLLAKLGNAQ